MLEKRHFKKIDNLDLLAKQVVEGFITGLHKSPFHGFSVEFAEHRLYNSGESTRYIDWKLFARTDKLFVKRFEEETNLRSRIIIDQSSSMYFPYEKTSSTSKYSKIHFSIVCAAALIHLLRRQRDAVGLSLFSDIINLHTSEKTSIKHHQFLIYKLENALKQNFLMKTSNLVDGLHQIAENIHKRSLVILFSDMFDNTKKSSELLSALQHLKFNKHEVILFHVMDKSKEFKFDYENRPYKFIDMETSEEIKLTPNEIRKNFINNSKKFQEDLKLKCLKNKIDYVETDVNKGFDSVLLSYIRKRADIY
tara:strand:+ start:217 stop:1137 length:921 start_codon:yes stop_codon:yes gene_type:complete